VKIGDTSEKGIPNLCLQKNLILSHIFTGLGILGIPQKKGIPNFSALF